MSSTEVRVSPSVRRDPDVLLHGEYQGSAYEEPIYLVTRGEATMQVTPLLFTLLDELDELEVRPDGTIALVDKPRSSEELAQVLSRRLGRELDADDIDFLVEEKLKPLHLVRAANDQDPAPPTPIPDPLLALRFRFPLFQAPVTQAVARVLSILFHPAVAFPMLIAYAVAFVATLDGGLVDAYRQVLREPWHLVFLYVAVTTTGLWHELGHAAACHRGGGRPGRIGAGLYLIWPAFFTDVTDSYRLSRGARLRTDLGGVYFNLVLGVAAYAAHLVTGYDVLLFLVVVQLAEVLYQFVPFLRLDGYWVVSDLTGVPDLFPLMKPAVRSLRPGATPDPAIAGLRRPARWAITAWALVTFPLVAINLIVLALVGPTVVEESFAIADEHLDSLRRAGDIGVAEAIIAAFGLAASLAPVAGIALTVLLFGGHGVRWLSLRLPEGSRTVWAVRATLTVAALITIWLAVEANRDDDGHRLETVSVPAATRADSTGSTDAPAAAGHGAAPDASSAGAPALVAPSVDADADSPPAEAGGEPPVTPSAPEATGRSSTAAASAATSTDGTSDVATDVQDGDSANNARSSVRVGAASTPLANPVATGEGSARTEASVTAPQPAPTDPAPTAATPTPPPSAAAPQPSAASPDTGSDRTSGSTIEARAAAGGDGPSHDHQQVSDGAGTLASAAATSTGSSSSSSEASASVTTGSASDSAARAQAEEILDRLPVPGR